MSLNTYFFTSMFICWALIIFQGISAGLIPFPETKTKLSFIEQVLVFLFYMLGGIIVFGIFEACKIIIKTTKIKFSNWKNLPWREK